MWKFPKSIAGHTKRHRVFEIPVLDNMFFYKIALIIENILASVLHQSPATETINSKISSKSPHGRHGMISHLAAGYETGEKKKYFLIYSCSVNWF